MLGNRIWVPFTLFYSGAGLRFYKLGHVYTVVGVRPSTVALLVTARRYASAVCAVIVCPPVCPSQAGIVSKLLDESSWYGMEAVAEFLVASVVISATQDVVFRAIPRQYKDDLSA